MAALTFGKFKYSGVARIQIVDDIDDNIGTIRAVCYTGQLIQLTFKKSSNIRVECKSNLQDLQCGNCATIIGDVQHAIVKNSLRVDGTIDKFKSSRNRIDNDSTLKICYGTERAQREGWKIGKRSRIVHIDGDLLGLVVNVSNVRIETVVLGNVQEVKVGNTLDVKGKVNDCIVDNMIYCTNGKSLAKSTQQIQKERKSREDMHNRILGSLFSNLY